MACNKRYPIEPHVRFEKFLFYTGDCIVWTGSSIRKGYGKFHDGRGLVLAHRYSYEQSFGPIPPGLVVNHLCRNPCCVSPVHLEVVTNKQNTLHHQSLSIAAFNANKTHCPKGHAYSFENTTRRPGGRQCRMCNRETMRLRVQTKEGRELKRLRDKEYRAKIKQQLQKA